MYHDEVECQAEKNATFRSRSGCYLQGQSHSKGLNNQNMSFKLLISLQPNSVWQCSIISRSGVSCDKIGLLRSRLRSQRRFKMSLNVCPDIFWTAVYFVTNLGMVMQHHEVECLAEKMYLLYSKSRSQWGLIWSKYDCFYYFLWSADSFATKLCLMVHHHKPDCQSHSHSEDSYNQIWLFIPYLLNYWSLCYQV